MEATDLLDSPIVIGLLVLLGLVIALKLLGLAMKAITVIAVLAAAGYLAYLYSNGTIG